MLSGFRFRGRINPGCREVSARRLRAGVPPFSLQRQLNQTRTLSLGAVPHRRSMLS